MRCLRIVLVVAAAAVIGCFSEGGKDGGSGDGCPGGPGCDCESNDDCDGGVNCEAGLCAYDECKSGGDCPGAEPICDFGMCVPCNPTADACPAMTHCVEGQCAPGCAQDSQCTMGWKCDTATNECVECSSDADCNGGTCTDGSCG